MLNNITHPHIFLLSLKRCREYINDGMNKIVFDAPVLFESNSDLMCDAVVSVIAPKEVRMERLKKRDNIDEKTVEERINAQHDDYYYTEKSDYVIDGSNSLEKIRQAVADIVRITDVRR